MSKVNQIHTVVAKILLAIVITIIVLLPFHAFVTTWIGSNTGGLLLVRAWKELLLVVAVVLAAFLLVQDPLLRKKFFSSNTNKLIVLCSVWIMLVTLLNMRDLDAGALGLAINLRFFVIYLVAQIGVYYVKIPEAWLSRLVLYPAVLVVGFGVLQMLVLPIDFLRHFGYQKGVTIQPYFTIDEQVSRLRIFSTLRGPNTLGVYLIMPIMFIVSRLRQLKGSDKNTESIKPVAVYGLFLVASLFVLYGSHSRSAWLGLIAAFCSYLFIRASHNVRRGIMVSVVVASLMLGGLFYTARDTRFVQDVIIHDNPNQGGGVNPNEGRLRAMEQGVSDVISRPIAGCGAGCAGPASVHNQAGANLSENYFIQIAQEAGLIGLALYLAIFIMVARKLLMINSELSRSLFGIFVGVFVASLFSHAWADDTIAYVWWGVAGLVISLAHNHSDSVSASARSPHTYR